jgi:oligopeptide transport system substrate-binding protein
VTLLRFKINFDNNYGFKELNPATCQDTSTANVLHNIFKGLMVYQGNSLVNGTIMGYSFDIQLNQYSFDLDDSKWSDGKPICAQDYLEAWLKVIRLKGPNAESFKVIKNVDKYLRGEVSESAIGLEVLTDKRLSVQLENYCHYFLHLTASTPFLPVPVGSEANEIGFTGNHHFNLKNNYTNAILLESMDGETEVFITCDANEESIHQKFMDKEIDLSDGIPSKYLDIYEQHKAITYVPEFGTAFLQFNCNNLSYEERKVLVSPIDPAELMDNIKQIKVAENYIPWDLLSESKSNRMAQEESIGNLNGRTLRLLVNNVNLYRDMAIILKNQMEDASGELKVEIISADWESFTEALQNNDFDLALSGWIGDYFDPHSMLSIWQTGSANNFSRFSDEKFDSLISFSEQCFDEKERMRTFKDAENILLSQAVVLPLYHYHLPLLIQNDLSNENIRYSPLGIIDFNTFRNRDEVFMNGFKC